MTTEHDEALVERVALAIFNAGRRAAGLKEVGDFSGSSMNAPRMRGLAVAAIYLPALPAMED